MPDPTAPTSEILNRAADLIEERGWAIGNCAMDARPGAPLCLEGALGAAAGVKPDDYYGFGFPMYDYDDVEALPAYPALRAYLGWSSTTSLFVWNDRQDGGAGVVEVLRACAVIEESRERQAVEVSA